ncbi:MAG TPA: glycosyltransferase family 39 protein [Candidatus Dormibacteraeota bacterium]|nr:glycosyltransferase family 39 protein [Candidatus Dormibacteraeota bacterium]
MAAHRLTIPRQAAAAPIVVGLTIAVAHLPVFAHRLLDGDEAIYGSIAALMNMGGGLYDAGGVDNKPPGIFWVYAMTFRLFGTYQMTAVHAVALLVVLATCAVLYLVARDLASPRAGLLAALFYGVLTAAGNPRLLAANTEVFMMLPLCASVLFMLWRRWFWAGALLVAAGAFRQSAAANVLLAVIGLFWLEEAARRAGAATRLAGGLLAGLAAGAASIALTGSLAGFWRWTIATLVGYASNTWAPAYAWSRAQDSLVPFVLDMAVLWIAAIGLTARWRSIDRKTRLMVVWLALGFAGSLAGGHLSWHYFIQAMGPLAVLAAIAFDRIELRRAVAVAAAVGIAVPAVAWWSFDVNADPLTYDFSPPIPQHAAVASYIDAHTSPSDRIFVWGDWAALYVESDRLMACRFPGFLRGFDRGSDVTPNSWDVAPDVWPALAADFSAHPPRLIVDTSTADWSDFSKYPIADYPVLAGIVATQYHQLTTVDGVVIYVRNDGT